MNTVPVLNQDPNTPRVLLVEDDVAQARMIEGMLRTGGGQRCAGGAHRRRHRR